MAIIHPLMRDTMLTAMDLDADARDPFNVVVQPRNRMRIRRAKAALERVGVDGSSISTFRRLGYYLAFQDRPSAQMFAGRRLKLLERILHTHPNKEMVAELLGR